MRAKWLFFFKFVPKELFVTCVQMVEFCFCIDFGLLRAKSVGQHTDQGQTTTQSSCRAF